MAKPETDCERCGLLAETLRVIRNALVDDVVSCRDESAFTTGEQLVEHIDAVLKEVEA